MAMADTLNSAEIIEMFRRYVVPNYRRYNIVLARGEGDAPDIDGRVYVPRNLPVGSFATVTINGHHDYDLLALPAGESPAQFKVAKQAQ